MSLRESKRCQLQAELRHSRTKDQQQQQQQQGEQRAKDQLQQRGNQEGGQQGKDQQQQRGEQQGRILQQLHPSRHQQSHSSNSRRVRYQHWQKTSSHSNLQGSSRVAKRLKQAHLLQQHSSQNLLLLMGLHCTLSLKPLLKSLCRSNRTSKYHHHQQQQLLRPLQRWML
jgi:hypothetical protein